MVSAIRRADTYRENRPGSDGTVHCSLYSRNYVDSNFSQKIWQGLRPQKFNSIQSLRLVLCRVPRLSSTSPPLSIEPVNASRGVSMAGISKARSARSERSSQRRVARPLASRMARCYTVPPPRARVARSRLHFSNRNRIQPSPLVCGDAPYVDSNFSQKIGKGFAPKNCKKKLGVLCYLLFGQ